jgi:hypothetical protein
MRGLEGIVRTDFNLLSIIFLFPVKWEMMGIRESECLARVYGFKGMRDF